jgi:hypothetical protein
MNEYLNQLFSNLDTWRHFPAYQLERRADIFFSVYLLEYLKSERGYDVQSIIPEFPIRVGTIDPKNEDLNRSFKVDYLVKVRQPNSVLFIELKTDKKSIEKKQDGYLQDAKNKKMPLLLEGLRSIYRATNARDKYRHLLKELEDATLIKNVCDCEFDVVRKNTPITVLRLQPTGNAKNIITFKQFADFVGTKEDELSRRFSKSLKEWATTKAGARSS